VRDTLISIAGFKTFDTWRTKVGVFCAQVPHVSNGLIFNYDNVEKMEPGAEITFGDFIAN